jgi:hypothetical protein
MTNLIIIKLPETAAKFQNFIETADLVKIAKTWMGLSECQQHIYIHRVLQQCARINCSQLDASKFYGQVLVMAALRALINQQTKLINS